MNHDNETQEKFNAILLLLKFNAILDVYFSIIPEISYPLNSTQTAYLVTTNSCNSPLDRFIIAQWSSL